ncbi:hypothetical protein LINPERPRIM_LOCUS41315 [Linum perenne]
MGEALHIHQQIVLSTTHCVVDSSVYAMLWWYL